MTTESKKPSDRILRSVPLGDYRGVDLDLRGLCDLVDELHERFAKLEAAAPPPEDLDPVKALYAGATCRWCRKTYAEHLPPEQANRPRARCPCLCWRENFVPREPAAPVGVYEGDGHPALRRAEDSGSYEASEDPE